jgi:hypothetical protein
MSIFGHGPAAPPPPPPPPTPPSLASTSIQQAGANTRAAAAAAAGQLGFDNTIGTSPAGAAAPNTTGGKTTTGDR